MAKRSLLMAKQSIDVIESSKKALLVAKQSMGVLRKGKERIAGGKTKHRC